MAGDGIWDEVQRQLHELANREDPIDWSVSVDSTIARAYQHATNVTRLKLRELAPHALSRVELHLSEKTAVKLATGKVTRSYTLIGLRENSEDQVSKDTAASGAE